MRILQINKYHYVRGGAERYYMDVSRHLTRRGHVVVPFSVKHPRNEETEYSRYFVEGVDYRSHLGLSQKLREGVRAVYNREAERKVSSLIKRTHPDIAHLHNIYHSLTPSVVIALDRLGIPMVHSLHDYKIICPGYLLFESGKICERCKRGMYVNAVINRCLLNSYAVSCVAWIEAALHRTIKTYGRVARFLCPSRFLMEKCIEFGIPREKLIHVPYFLPLGESVPAYEPSDYFIYLGRLSPEKGLGTLLRALSQMRSRRLTCLILGEGPLEQELKQKVSEQGLSKVSFAGYLDGTRLKDTIRGAAFSVVPSEWYENLPYSVLESFALGTPVLGSQIGGIPEMVRDGQTGQTFPAGNVIELAAQLEWMESHPAETRLMGRNARKLVEERYAPEAHLKRLESIYHEVVR